MCLLGCSRATEKMFFVTKPPQAQGTLENTNDGITKRKRAEKGRCTGWTTSRISSKQLV